MKILFLDTHPRVEQAIESANELLQSESFYDNIKLKDAFHLSTATPVQIADLIKASSLEFKVDLFHPNMMAAFRKYRKTLAYTNSRYPNTLFLNDRKLNRSKESIAATIIHEAVHALDHNCAEYKFGHGNNSAVGKQDTAPYWIGNLVNRLLKDDPAQPLLEFDQEENEADWAVRLEDFDDNGLGLENNIIKGSVIDGEYTLDPNSNGSVYLKVEVGYAQLGSTSITIDDVSFRGPARNGAGAIIHPDANGMYQKSFNVNLGTNRDLRGKKLVLVTTIQRIQADEPRTSVSLSLNGGPASKDFPVMEEKITTAGGWKTYLATIQLTS